MAKFKNIRIKKPGGGSRLQRVKVLASGKYRFVKNVTKSAKSRGSNPKTKTKRKSVRKMARRKRRRRSKGMTIPLAPIAGLAAGMVQPIQLAMAGDFPTALGVIVRNYTGFSGVETGNPQFNVANLQQGLAPLIVGALIHKYVGGKPLNLNRMLASAGVPLMRI